MKTTNDWLRILTSCNVKPATAIAWAPVFANTISDDTFSSPDDLAPFLGQILVESRLLEKLEEDLNYTTAERICAVWPRRFPTLADARPYVRNPEALANRTYGGRMGNVEIGDGWRYRGRGFPMITGRTGYAFTGDLIGQDLEHTPELLTQPHFALQAGIQWWEKRIPDAILNDPEAVTKKVQGGDEALARRIELTDLARAALA
ncbi:glycoside hydrolase family 19 protein [Rhodoferax koreense]|nr:glycoside hydrolase family 19 protein [Rhodoferax koreense]